MSAQPCLLQDFLEVNNSKEYTLISTALLESVLTDSRLNAQTSKLWQILFNKARYNPNLEIKISYSYLAKQIGKSTRTIARYIESLQNTGYLTVKHNFDKNGGQRPSSISVRVPTTLIEHANKKKDRINKKRSANNETLLISDSLISESAPNEAISQTSSDNITVLCGTIPDSNENVASANLVNDAAMLSVNSDAMPSTCDTASSIIACDKIDRAGYDINVVQKDINKKAINTNNNNLVVLDEDNQSIVAIQKEINCLEKQLSESDKMLSVINDHSTRYDQIRKNSQINAALQLAKHALERKRKEINESAQKTQFLRKLENPSYMATKIGERTLPTFTFKRLVKSLESYGYKGSKLHSLINEIVFEARFGSLMKCNRTNVSLNIDKAINIALKLVRETRWSTPVLLMQQEQ